MIKISISQGIGFPTSYARVPRSTSHARRRLCSLPFHANNTAVGRCDNIVKNAIATPRRDSLLSGHGAFELYRNHASYSTDLSSGAVKYFVTSFSQENELATITISHPTKTNILNSRLFKDLISTCESLKHNANLRAVVLTGDTTAAGKPPAFIGGADIKEMQALSLPAEARAFITLVHEACAAIRAIPVPVIARVHGLVLGAGLEIMASCDLRIATIRSAFGMPEVRVGIPSVVEAALLPGLIGMGRTRRLLYLGEVIEAEEAEWWGLVEKVVGAESELDDAVHEWVVRLSEAGPKAIRSQKALMQKWENCSLAGGIEAGIDAFEEAFRDGAEEPKDMMGKFLNRKRA